MRIGFGKAEAYGKTKLTEKEKPQMASKEPKLTKKTP
jgi:hypothetical protein